LAETLGEGALPPADAPAGGTGPSPAGTEYNVDPTLLPAFAAAVEAQGSPAALEAEARMQDRFTSEEMCAV
ncbi:hypothetical protein ABPG75_011680, partial [Micractinium tetrahymenae]